MNTRRQEAQPAYRGVQANAALKYHRLHTLRLQVAQQTEVSTHKYMGQRESVCNEVDY